MKLTGGKEILRLLKRGNNSKGFNLFSALVAAVLLATSVVLVNTLVSTEDRMSNQLYGMFNNYQLSDAANLARADALQSFNYNFREQLENYLTYNDYELENEPGMSLLDMDNYQDWDEVVKKFEEVILLTGGDEGRQFDAALEYVAKRTVDNFTEGSYGRYNVSLSSKSSEAKMAVRNALSAAMKLQEDEPFLEVVGCSCDNAGESAENCPVGTFYFNIPLNKIDQEYYEALPRIIVKDLVTGEEMKIAILPRTNLKVYIPLRFFRALCEATMNANAVDKANKTLRGYRLGFCDNCNPRTSPDSAASGSSWLGHACPSGESGSNVTLGDKPFIYVGDDYFSGGGNPGKPQLIVYTIDAVCGQGIDLGITTGSDTFVNYGNKNGLLDASLPSNTKDYFEGSNGCPFHKISASPKGVKKKNIDTTENYLYCEQINGVTADVVYEETDPMYIISGSSNKYMIRISDADYTLDSEGNGKCATKYTGSTTPNCCPAGSDC